MHWFAAIAVVVIHAAVEAQRLLGPGQGFAGAEVGGALVVESVVVALIVSLPLVAGLREQRGVWWCVAVLALAQISARAMSPTRQGPGADGRGRTVVLLTIDTLRVDASTLPGLPHLEALRNQSLVFAAAQAPAPVTLPSHLSMLTGLPVSQHGVTRNEWPAPSIPHIGQVLGEDGFTSGAFVSSAVLHPDQGLADGFDVYRSPTSRWAGAESLLFARWLAPGSGAMAAKTPGDLAVARSLAWLGSLDRDASAFVWVHLYDPHLPHLETGPGPELTLADPCDWLGHPAGLRRGTPRLFDARRPPVTSQDCSRGVSPVARARSYAAQLAAVDRGVGTLVTGLRSLGRWADARVVFASDHGESLTEHQAWVTHEHVPYQSVAAVPLWLRDPGCDACVGEHRDVVSTTAVRSLLEHGGVGLPAASQAVTIGASVVPPATWTAGDPEPLQAVVRGGDRVVMVDESGHIERYDLVADPGQRHPINSADECEALARQVVARLREPWRAGTASLGPQAPWTDEQRQALSETRCVAGSVEDLHPFAPLVQRARSALAQTREARERVRRSDQPMPLRDALRALGYVDD